MAPALFYDESARCYSRGRLLRCAKVWSARDTFHYHRPRRCGMKLNRLQLIWDCLSHHPLSCRHTLIVLVTSLNWFCMLRDSVGVSLTKRQTWAMFHCRKSLHMLWIRSQHVDYKMIWIQIRGLTTVINLNTVYSNVSTNIWMTSRNVLSNNCN